MSEREQLVRSQPAGALLGRELRAQPVALVLSASLPPAGARFDGGTGRGEEGAQGETETETATETGEGGRGPQWFECPLLTRVGGSESAMTRVASVLLQ